MKHLKIRGFLLFALFSAFTMQGCQTIAHFDQTAYSQIVSAEVDALSLIDKSTDDFSLHQKEIEDVYNKIQKAYLYDKNRPLNDIPAQMWELMMDPTGSLFGGFLVLWEKEKKLGKFFVQEFHKKIKENFDRMAQLESKKIKS